MDTPKLSMLFSDVPLSTIHFRVPPWKPRWVFHGFHGPWPQGPQGNETWQAGKSPKKNGGGSLGK